MKTMARSHSEPGCRPSDQTPSGSGGKAASIPRALRFCRKCDEQVICLRLGCAWFKSYPQGRRKAAQETEAEGQDAEGSLVHEGSVAGGDAPSPDPTRQALTAVEETKDA